MLLGLLLVVVVGGGASSGFAAARRGSRLLLMAAAAVVRSSTGATHLGRAGDSAGASVARRRAITYDALFEDVLVDGLGEHDVLAYDEVDLAAPRVDEPRPVSAHRYVAPVSASPAVDLLVRAVFAVEDFF